MIRDAKHLAWIRTLPCCRCGGYPSQAAHIRRHGGGGIGIKSGDNAVLPQCHECHSLSHQRGENAFYQDVFKAIELARGLYLFSGDTVTALGLISRKRGEVF